MKKHILAGIGLFFLLLSCTQKSFDISNIRTRAQLDSIMALLPEDSVRIDSLPYRTLYISLRGKFMLHGVVVNRVNFSLEKEKLSSMNISFETGCLSLLNTLEQKEGLAKYDDSFCWYNLVKSIELKPSTGYWSSVEPINVSDTVGGEYSEKYYNPVRNKVTDIGKEIEVSDEFIFYSMDISGLDSDVNYKIYINALPVSHSGNSFDNEVLINEYLVSFGNQSIVVEFLPPYGNYMDYLLRSLSGSSYYSNPPELKIYKQQKNGEKKEILKKIAFLADDIASKKHCSFSLPLIAVDFAPDYTKNADLRQVADLKDKLYDSYLAMKKALEDKDENKIVDMLYPPTKTMAIAYNWDEQRLQKEWRSISSTMNDNDGVELYDKDKLDVVFYCNGRLATLKPKPDAEYDSALFVYETDGDTSDYTYVVFMNEKGELVFAPKM